MKNDNTGVYSISCDDCKQVYVWQTGRSLHARIKEHRRDSRCPDNHYQSGHSVSFDSGKVIHYEQNLTKRLIAEAFLIRDN